MGGSPLPPATGRGSDTQKDWGHCVSHQTGYQEFRDGLEADFLLWLSVYLVFLNLFSLVLVLLLLLLHLLERRRGLPSVALLLKSLCQPKAGSWEFIQGGTKVVVQQLKPLPAKLLSYVRVPTSLCCSVSDPAPCLWESTWESRESWPNLWAPTLMCET